MEQDYVSLLYEQECSIYEQNRLIGRLADMDGHISSEISNIEKEGDTGHIKGLVALLGSAALVFAAFLLAPTLGIIALAAALAYFVISAVSSSSAEKQRAEKIESLLSQKSELERVLKELEAQLSSDRELLQEMYDLDIIPQKYRNFIAISSFYEYFFNGDCTTLNGSGGAYDKLETMMRLDRIVSDLDLISKEPDAIRQYQYMTYTAVTVAGNNIERSFEELAEAVQGTGVDTDALNVRNANVALDRHLSELAAREAKLRSSFELGRFDSYNLQ